MLICAQSRTVTGLERKIDPASSARSSREGVKDNNNRLLRIVNMFCIPFGTARTISICGGLESDCIVVTLHRVASFRVMHLNSDTERARRDILLLVLLLVLL